MMLYILIVFALIPFSEQSEKKSLNILGIFPYEGKSHFFVFEPYLQELALRGHNVTVISCFPRKNTMKNYHDISLAGKSKILENVMQIKHSYTNVIEIVNFILTAGSQNCRTMLEDENIQNLWKTKTKFDVIVVEQFNSDCALGIAYKLGAPVVGITSHTLMPWHYERFGIPVNPSFVPLSFFGGGTKPTFYQRIERTISYALFKLFYKLKSQRMDQNTLAEYIDGVPPLEQLGHDIKFQLVYSNFVLFGSSLHTTNIIEVNGYHVEKPKPLPTDLKKFIDDSEHGVIFISFGSMLKATTAPVDKVKAIIEAVSTLKQRVIWKWEAKSLPGNPKNIHISNWLPQNDILANPKVMAFYSHCGLLSTTEAIYHGVPIVGMPVFGDQPSNAAAIEESGFGVQIQLNELTKENLVEKFKTILDPTFRKRVKELSRAWHDRPLSAMNSAVYWTEFAARHHNLTFRAAAASVPFYQYHGLDVLGILLFFSLIIAFVLKYFISFLISLIFKTEPTMKSKKHKLH